MAKFINILITHLITYYKRH